MDSTDQYALACYQQVTVLSAQHRVYLVKHTISGKIFVKKVLYRYNKSVIEHLMEEPLPGIPLIYDMAEQDGALIVIEEYVPGSTLQEQLEEEGCFLPVQVRSMMLQLCEIVRGLHSSTPPIIHRDIKPDNIIVTADGSLKLIDLNAARLYSNSKDQDTMLLGTEGYAAPEQYGFAESSVQTDIYSMGVLMNVLLTGHLPREGLAAEPFGSIIQRCTQLESAKRYGAVEELSRAIGAAGETETPPAPRRSLRRYLPPGFRTGNPAKMVAALLCYWATIDAALHIDVTDLSPGGQRLAYRLLVALMLLAMIFFSNNYLDVWRLLPLTRSSRRPVKAAGVLLVNAVWFFSFMLMLSVLFPSAA